MPGTRRTPDLAEIRRAPLMERRGVTLMDAYLNRNHWSMLALQDNPPAWACEHR